MSTVTDRLLDFIAGTDAGDQRPLTDVYCHLVSANYARFEGSGGKDAGKRARRHHGLAGDQLFRGMARLSGKRNAAAMLWENAIGVEGHLDDSQKARLLGLLERLIDADVLPEPTGAYAGRWTSRSRGGSSRLVRSSDHLFGRDALTQFARSVEDAPAEAQSDLRRAVKWARDVDKAGLATAHARANPTTPTLNLWLPGEKRGLVTIWNDDHSPQLAFDGPLVRERAGGLLGGIEELVAPKPLGRTTATHDFSNATFETLTALYREATGRGRGLPRRQQIGRRTASVETATGADLFAERYEPGRRGPLSRRDPFEVDPNEIDRSTQMHQDTQDALWRDAKSRDLEALPASRRGIADFDLGWFVGDDRVVIVEVKSITDANEARQIRLGLGQLLDYVYAIEESGHKTTAVLAVSREPARAARWSAVCSKAGVLLVWPATWSNALWPA